MDNHLNTLPALKQQMTLHTGEKAHSCTQCNKSFSTLSTLKEHMMHRMWQIF